MNIMKILRKRAKTEEIDFLFIMNCLSSYKSPRDKLTKLLKSKQLIRVKKGIYIFGEEYRNRPYSLEILANLLYGPSYISFEYALSYYNLIPEKVVRITNACSKRIKHFKTPIGDFVYYYIPPKKYSVGIKLESIDANSYFLIATKEKALADLLARIKTFDNKNDLIEYLTQSMRINLEDLQKFNTSLLEEISKNYKNKNVKLLCQIMKNH
jgi:predicted transcriptional regulator of viral defense system